MGRSRGQRGSAATRTSAAAPYTGVGAGGLCARRIPDGRLGLRGGPGRAGTIRKRGRLGRNRVRDAPLGAMRVKNMPLMLPIRPMTDMGPGRDRRELNDDQEDRRSNYPPNCSGRSHVQVLLYDPGQVNNG